MKQYSRLNHITSSAQSLTREREWGSQISRVNDDPIAMPVPKILFYYLRINRLTGARTVRRRRRAIEHGKFARAHKRVLEFFAEPFSLHSIIMNSRVQIEPGFHIKKFG